MNELALFTGIGGGLLASKLLGWRTVCYVENNEYCVEVLKARIKDGYLDDAPIWDDVRTFDGRPWRGSVDIITAGFPCQPFSVAGKNKGKADERNMWPDTIRIIREVRPRYVFLENVPNLLIHEYFGTILGSLVEGGYDCRWDCISAKAVGASHQRNRLWIVAHAGHRRRGNVRSIEKGHKPSSGWSSDSDPPCGSGDELQVVADTKGKQNRRLQFRGIQPNVKASNRPMADADKQGLQGRGRFDNEGECPCQLTPWACNPAHEEGRLARSGIRRISNGIPKRVDRLKALGNAQVPLVAKTAWDLLMQD